MGSAVNRRDVVCLLGGASLLAFARSAHARQDARINHLIGAARALAQVSARMEFISRALIGSRYQANTLIGGPRRPEEFVVRDDAFDCVTYCEVVLAAALVRDPGEFDATLRRIRYRNGEVRWGERNHYFSQWSKRAVENEICRPVPVDGAVSISKTLNWGNLGRRQVSMTAVPRAALMANGGKLADGDIIGFVSRRPSLDFFHTGLVITAAKGDVLLRHASQSRRRVLEEPLARFVAANGVQHVTLLRPVERPAAGTT
jgi:hypothetical protein